MFLTVTATATKVLAEVFPALQYINLVHHSKYIVAIDKSCFTAMCNDCRIDNYALQVTGEENYVTGDIRLLDFKAVRRSCVVSQCKIPIMN